MKYVYFAFLIKMVVYVLFNVQMKNLKPKDVRKF